MGLFNMGDLARGISGGFQDSFNQHSPQYSPYNGMMQDEYARRKYEAMQNAMHNQARAEAPKPPKQDKRLLLV